MCGGMGQGLQASCDLWLLVPCHTLNFLLLVQMRKAESFPLPLMATEPAIYCSLFWSLGRCALVRVPDRVRTCMNASCCVWPRGGFLLHVGLSSYVEVVP